MAEPLPVFYRPLQVLGGVAFPPSKCRLPWHPFSVVPLQEGTALIVYTILICIFCCSLLACVFQALGHRAKRVLRNKNIALLCTTVKLKFVGGGSRASTAREREQDQGSGCTFQEHHFARELSSAHRACVKASGGRLISRAPLSMTSATADSCAGSPRSNAAACSGGGGQAAQAGTIERGREKASVHRQDGTKAHALWYCCHLPLCCPCCSARLSALHKQG